MNRRGVLRASGALVGSSLLAGCDHDQPTSHITGAPTNTPDPDAPIDGIEYGEHVIPMAEVHIVSGPNCDSEHYHAKTGNSVLTTDCEVIQDPGDCGFGKIEDTSIEIVEEHSYPCENG